MRPLLGALSETHSITGCITSENAAMHEKLVTAITALLAQFHTPPEPNGMRSAWDWACDGQDQLINGKYLSRQDHEKFIKEIQKDALASRIVPEEIRNAALEEAASVYISAHEGIPAFRAKIRALKSSPVPRTLAADTSASSDKDGVVAEDSSQKTGEVTPQGEVIRIEADNAQIEISGCNSHIRVSGHLCYVSVTGMSAVVDIGRQADALIAMHEIQKLREALATYGRHGAPEHHCAHMVHSDNKCDCGLEAVLTAWREPTK